MIFFFSFFNRKNKLFSIKDKILIINKLTNKIKREEICFKFQFSKTQFNRFAKKKPLSPSIPIHHSLLAVFFLHFTSLSKLFDFNFENKYFCFRKN